jgi:putative transposase
VREVLQGALYVLETGCQWRHLPKDFPPRSTVWAYFDLWRYDGTLDRIHETLYAALREMVEAMQAQLAEIAEAKRGPGRPRKSEVEAV